MLDETVQNKLVNAKNLERFKMRTDEQLARIDVKEDPNNLGKLIFTDYTGEETTVQGGVPVGEEAGTAYEGSKGKALADKVGSGDDLISGEHTVTDSLTLIEAFIGVGQPTETGFDELNTENKSIVAAINENKTKLDELQTQIGNVSFDSDAYSPFVAEESDIASLFGE